MASRDLPAFNRSQTFIDVSEVCVPPDDPRSSAALRRTPTGSMLEEAVVARQAHEDQPAEVVIVCEPEGTSLMMGGLHPRASLYEKPVNLDAAKQVHSARWVVDGAASVRAAPTRVSQAVPKSDRARNNEEA